MNTNLLPCLAIPLMFSPVAGAVEAQQLYGTWKIESSKQTIVATGEIRYPQGTAPLGFLTYGEDGRMSVIIVDSSRAKPADLAKLVDADRATLYNSMVAYAGDYRVAGSKITHDVEVSWNEAWTGTQLVLHIRLEGEILYITSEARPSGVDGKMTVTELKWKRLTKSHDSKAK
jgi:hypothetical protein